MKQNLQNKIYLLENVYFKQVIKKTAILLFVFGSLLSQSFGQCIGTTTTYSETTPVAISNGAPSVVTSTIVVSGTPTFLYKLTVLTGITHSFSSDLDITLTSPAGTVVTLTTDNGSGNDDVFNGTTWDDKANPGDQVPYANNEGLVTEHTYTNLITATPLVPEEPLAAFIGENPNGTWTITISDDAAIDGGSLNNWALNVTSLPLSPFITAASSFTNSTPTAIPTGPAVVTSSIVVSGLGNQLYDVTALTNLTHTFSGDLDITIMSPSGTIVTLTTDNGASADNVFNGTLWDDNANPGGQVPYTSNDGMVTEHVFVNLTTATPLTPEEALGAFIGEDPNGTWTITISDDAIGDGGSLDSWTLNIRTSVCCSIVCPANMNVSNDLNQCGAVVTYPSPTTTGNCGSVTTNPPSGSFFPVGPTIVTATSPSTGASCSFIVNVNDNQNPTITCPGDIVICGGSQVVTFSDATASDNCPGVSVAQTGGLPSGSVFPVGTTTITYTATDAYLNTASCSFDVIINEPPIPTITSNTGSFSFCKNSYVILDAGAYDSYLWSIGATTQTIATNSGSTYTVTVTDVNGCTGSASETTIRVLSVPAKPGTITGPTSGLCNTSGNIFSISPTANTDYYLWTVTNGIITSGQGTTSIEVEYFGFSTSTITVKAQNACGYSSPRSITVNAKPAAPLTIHGNKNGVCKLSGEKYSVDLVDGAVIYRWTVPSNVAITSGQGTPDIEVTFGSSFSSGNICCRTENSCGNSAYTCLSVSAKPQKPVTIFGPTSVCRHQSGVVYSTPSVYGATSYIWGVPSGAIIQSGQGTASITVKFGTHSGNVDVKAKNSCGTSSDYDLNVRIVCRETGEMEMGEVNVYPNPSHGNLNVSITSEMNQKCIVRMIDLIGKQMMLDAVNLTEGNNLFQYDVSGYAGGLYFFVIEREGMPSETIRVVVE